MSLITSLDMRVLEALYAIRDPLLVQIFIGMSELGRTVPIFGLAICSALVLALKRRYGFAVGLCLSVATSGTLILLIKGVLQRERPGEFFQAYPEIWYSFPSAHAALSAALYIFLAYMSWKLIPHYSLRIIATAFFILLPFVISFSRLYLGVHYLSDVVAGLLLGGACAWLGIWWVRFVHRS